MLKDFEAIVRDLKFRYKVALDDVATFERIHVELNFTVDALSVSRYIAEEEHWNKRLDKAYQDVVDARNILDCYKRALENASKLYSALQDLKSYGEFEN